MSERPISEKKPRVYETGAVQDGKTPTISIEDAESRAEAIPTTGIFTQRDTRQHMSANQREAITELEKREHEQYERSHPEHTPDRKAIIEKEKK